MKKIILILFIAFSVFIFIGCNNEKEYTGRDTTDINEIELDDIELEGYNFLGYYQNNEEVTEINDLNENCESEYIDCDILNLHIESLEVENILNKYINYYWFNAINESPNGYNYNQKYYNSLDELGRGGLAACYYDDSIDSFSKLHTGDNYCIYPLFTRYYNGISSNSMFTYFIPITNDILNNELVFCDVEISATTTVVIRDREDIDKCELYQEFIVDTDDFINYKLIDFDFSEANKNIYNKNGSIYILNKETGAPIEVNVIPVNCFLLDINNFKNKINELVDNEYVSTDKTFREYMEDDMKCDLYRLYISINFEIYVSVLIDGQEVNKTYNLEYYYDQSNGRFD